jgi:hypothetical protein
MSRVTQRIDSLHGEIAVMVGVKLILTEHREDVAGEFGSQFERGGRVIGCDLGGGAEVPHGLLGLAGELEFVRTAEIKSPVVRERPAEDANRDDEGGQDLESDAQSYRAE